MNAAALRQRLERKCAEALASHWDHTQPLAIKLDPPPRDAGDGRLAVGAAYLVQARNGSWVEVHREADATLSDDASVDDFLARGLSVLLMKHPAWPK